MTLADTFQDHRMGKPKAYSVAAKRRARKGRPRKAAARYVNGHVVGASKGEREADVVALAVKWRTREVGAGKARQPEAGYALGRMLLKGMISEAQHRAGVDWAEIVARYCSLAGIKPPVPASGGFEMVSRGLPCGDPPSDELLRRATQAHQDAYVALRDDDRTGAWAKVCRDICILDYHEGALDEEQIGNLRCGLNALARHFGIDRGAK